MLKKILKWENLLQGIGFGKVPPFPTVASGESHRTMPKAAAERRFRDSLPSRMPRRALLRRKSTGESCELLLFRDLDPLLDKNPKKFSRTVLTSEQPSCCCFLLIPSHSWVGPGWPRLLLHRFWATHAPKRDKHDRTGPPLELQLFPILKLLWANLWYVSTTSG